MGYDSVTTWRLYSAEQSVGLGGVLDDVDAARRLVRKIKRSRWWRENTTEQPRISLELGGDEGSDGELISYAWSDRNYLPERWKLSIHPDMLNDLVVLHEVAHCIAPRWSPALKPRRKGQVPSHAQLFSHGAGFAGAMAELVREFGKGAVHDELREAYQHFGVPVMSPTEYQIAVADSLKAERDLVEFDQELAEFLAASPKLPGQRSRGWIPQRSWGETFYLARTHHHRLGMDRLARIVSQVTPCTRRDIKAVESAKDLPEDERSRRVALCLSVVFDIDPVYAEHHLRLKPSDCGIDLDELRPLNPGWTYLVSTMNRLLAERPPKWYSEGER